MTERSESERAELSAAPQPAPGWDEATGYAERLSVALWEKHYKTDAPQWEPFSGDLIGILTQIDNMTTGLSRSSQSTSDAGGGVREALKPFAEYKMVVIGFNGAVSKDDLKDCTFVAGFTGRQPEFRHFEAAKAALSNPAASNASAEARLREALERALPYIKPAHPGDVQADADARAVEAALSPDHASDCDKQGETTKSEGLCPVPPGKNAPVSTRTARDEGGSNLLAHTERMMSDSESIGSLAHDVATSQRENGVSPGPSDRTDDVTCESLAWFIKSEAKVDFGGWQADLARALLDAFEIRGR